MSWIENMLDGFRKKTLNRLARQTGFVCRQGKLTAHDFVLMMTVGQLALKHPSLGGMVESIKARLSREGLHQRFTPQAVAFMQACLNDALRRKITPPSTHRAGHLAPLSAGADLRLVELGC